MVSKKVKSNLLDDFGRYIGYKGITKEEFFTDIALTKGKQMKSSDFISNHSELFDGSIRAFGKSYNPNEYDKKFQSFLASFRRTYQNLHHQNVAIIKQFGQDCKNIYYGMDLSSVKLAFHKFWKKIEYISAPRGFKKKTSYLFRTKTKPNGKKAFQSQKCVVNNWSLVMRGIKKDVKKVLQFITPLNFQKVMLGYKQFFELFKAPNHHKIGLEHGNKSGIVFNKKVILTRFNSNLNESNTFYNVYVSQSGQYFIYDSRIIISVYEI